MSMRAWTFVIKEILILFILPGNRYLNFRPYFFIRLRSIFKIDFLS